MKKIVFLFIAIIAIFSSCSKDASSPKDCIDAVNAALKEGNIEEATSIVQDFTSNHPLDADNIASAYEAICDARIEKGEYEKAINLVNGVFDLNDLERSVRKKVVDKCIGEGKYNEAVDFGDFRYDGYKTFANFICKCIDHMKANGKEQSIKSFIDRTSSIPDGYRRGWKKSNLKELYEYAGLDTSNISFESSDEDKENSSDGEKTCSNSNSSGIDVILPSPLKGKVEVIDVSKSIDSNSYPKVQITFKLLQKVNTTSLCSSYGQMWIVGHAQDERGVNIDDLNPKGITSREWRTGDSDGRQFKEFLEGDPEETISLEFTGENNIELFERDQNKIDEGKAKTTSAFNKLAKFKLSISN